MENFNLARSVRNFPKIERITTKVIAQDITLALEEFPWTFAESLRERYGSVRVAWQAKEFA